MRRIFSDWAEQEQSWIIAPMALWIAAYLAFIVFRMARDRRIYGPYQFAQQLGPAWKWSFAAAMAWLVIGAVTTSLADPTPSS